MLAIKPASRNLRSRWPKESRSRILTKDHYSSTRIICNELSSIWVNSLGKETLPNRETKPIHIALDQSVNMDGAHSHPFGMPHTMPHPSLTIFIFRYPDDVLSHSALVGLKDTAATE